MLPWAKSNLEQFWSANPAPFPSIKNIRWLSKQLQGLAAALATLQGPSSLGPNAVPDGSGIASEKHEGFRIENILWLQKDRDAYLNPLSGELQVADLSTVSSYEADVSQNNGFRNMITYRAAEYGLQRAVTSQTYDIWSLGLIHPEFVLWSLTGSSRTNEKFTTLESSEDPFDQSGDDEFSIKEAFLHEFQRAVVDTFLMVVSF